MDTSRSVTTLVIIVIVLLLCIVFIPMQQSDDEQYIRTWAAEHHHQVVKIERCWWTLGPYWTKGKNDRIYRLETENGAFWFRRGLFREDVEPGQ